MTGLILYQMIHPTSNNEAELHKILANLRVMKFPSTFDESLKENMLIRQLLHHEPERRPTIQHIKTQIKQCKINIREDNDSQHGILPTVSKGTQINMDKYLLQSIFHKI